MSKQKIDTAKLRYQRAVTEVERGGNSPAPAQYLMEYLAELRTLESAQTNGPTTGSRKHGEGQKQG